jgi:hypothetical protein
MPIINSQQYLFVNLDRVEMRSNNFYLDLKKNDPVEYYYIEYFSARGFLKFPIKKLLGHVNYQRVCNDPNFMLILNNTHEAFHSVVPHLYEHIVLIGEIPSEKVILVSESADLHEVVSTYARENNFKPFNVEWFMLFKRGLQEDWAHLQNTSPTQLKTYQDKKYEKVYLNFNRRWRNHRALTVSLLIAAGVLDKGYVSLGKSDMSSTLGHVFQGLLNFVQPNNFLFTLLLENKDAINNTGWLYLDTDDLVTNRASLESATYKFYEDSLVSLVSETNFFTDGEVGRFLSEKTWKPILLRHAFIMISVPRMLKLLRLQGYKTFHPFIDESYDGEFDPLTRLELIIKEVKRLSNMTDLEQTEFIKNITPIVEHNHKKFLNDNYYLKKFYVNKD